MSKIICYDSDGTVLKNLYQWDINRQITVTGIDVSSAVEFHFSNRFSSAALIVNVAISGENVIANIPNILLQQAETICLCIYCTSDNISKTTHVIEIPVYPRKKPDDYAYEATELKTWQSLDARIRALENGGGTTSGSTTIVESADVLVVTSDSLSASTSHSASEIYAAAESGKAVFFLMSYSNDSGAYSNVVLTYQGGTETSVSFGTTVSGSDAVVSVYAVVSDEKVYEPIISEYTGGSSSNIHVIDTETTDASEVDFSRFTVGDVLLITISE